MSKVCILKKFCIFVESGGADIKELLKTLFKSRMHHTEIERGFVILISGVYGN